MLDTNASDTGIGAVLSQEDDQGKERVIAYGSRLLSKPEWHCCGTRRELLAVVFFVNKFRPYLLGKHFKLRTDHGALTWLMSFKEPEGHMARWLEKLQEYDFEIKHRSGRKYTNADALSRLPWDQLVLKDDVLYRHFVSVDGTLDHLQLVPKSLQEKILK